MPEQVILIAPIERADWEQIFQRLSHFNKINQTAPLLVRQGLFRF